MTESLRRGQFSSLAEKLQHLFRLPGPPPRSLERAFLLRRNRISNSRGPAAPQVPARVKATVLSLLTILTGLASPARSAGTDSARLYSVPGDGAKLYVEVSGQGPPIVFLHGGLSYYDRSFAAQKAYFSTFRTVIGIDQRGHGHSPDDNQPFSYDQMADDTAAILQQLHVGPADIVGHSDGGNVGLILARRYPQLVRRLVVSGASFRGDLNGLWAYVRFRWSRHSHFAAAQPLDIRRSYDAVSPDGDAHWLEFASKTQDLWATWQVISPADLAAIRTPVLVMAGDHDAIPIDHTVALFHNLTAAELCVLPATGHETMKERPDEFNRVVRTFLEQPSH